MHCIPLRLLHSIYNRLILILFVFFLQAQVCLGQKQTYNWYFGEYMGINFDSDPVRVLTDGQISTLEGCATISDGDGNLLFYTDGRTVYNRKHQIMPNGTGLKGNYSTTQSAIIIPKPGSETIYYIFTADQIGYQETQGVHYSVVDICLAQGLGDVVADRKNIFLYKPATERLCATFHANGTDVWVTSRAYNSDRFVSYLVTEAGVSSTPVYSSAGYPQLYTVDPGSTDAVPEKAIGTMKFSPKGDKLAMVVNMVLTEDFYRGMVELFDFNNQTGVVSAAKQIYEYSRNFFPMIATYKNSYGYGLEFSPSGNRLYIDETDLVFYYSILQFNLETNTVAAVRNSKKVLYTAPNPFGDFTMVSAMQVGPDGRIYKVRGRSVRYENIYSDDQRKYLGVIVNPDEKQGPAVYEEKKIYLGIERIINEFTTNVTVGLPNFISSYSNPDPVIYTKGNVASQPTKFQIKSALTVASVEWDFGDGKTASSLQASHIYTQAGTFSCKAKVKLTDGQVFSVSKKLVLHSAPMQFLGKDTILCDNQPLILSAASVGGSYVWQDSSRNATLRVTKPGVYWVEVCGSDYRIRDSIQVRKLTLLGRDTSVCGGSPFYLNGKHLSHAGYTLSWSTGSAADSISVKNSGLYSLQITKNGCVITDSIQVTLTDCLDSLLVPNVFTPNDDGVNDSFEIKGISDQSWQLVIVDRYGRQVYQSMAYDNRWTGEGLVNGVYYYLLESSSQRKRYRGYVQLLR